MRSPIWWFGGKGNLVKKLLQHILKHKIYVEVFGGGGSLLFAKEPSPVEVYNDIDKDLVNFFRVLRDPEKFKEFHRLVSLTPYSRAEYYYCRDTWQDCKDEVERVYRWYVVTRMSFGGDFGGGWGYVVTKSCRGMSQAVSNWLSIIDLLPEIHQRIMRVQIECDDFRNIIPRYDTSDTFFYLDPPYMSETRKSGGYKHEMTTGDHEELVDMILQVRGKVMLSGYANPIYKKLEKAGWRRVDYQTACHAAGRTRQTGILGEEAATRMQPRVESIWLNYPDRQISLFE